MTVRHNLMADFYKIDMISLVDAWSGRGRTGKTFVENNRVQQGTTDNDISGTLRCDNSLKGVYDG